MGWLLKVLLIIRPKFEEGGKFNKFWAIYEAKPPMMDHIFL